MLYSALKRSNARHRALAQIPREKKKRLWIIKEKSPSYKWQGKECELYDFFFGTLASSDSYKPCRPVGPDVRESLKRRKLLGKFRMWKCYVENIDLCELELNNEKPADS